MLCTDSLELGLLPAEAGVLSVRVGVGHAQGHVPMTGHRAAVLMSLKIPHPHLAPAHPGPRGVIVIQRDDPGDPLGGAGVSTNVGNT